MKGRILTFSFLDGIEIPAEDETRVGVVPPDP